MATLPLLSLLSDEQRTYKTDVIINFAIFPSTTTIRVGIGDSMMCLRLEVTGLCQSWGEITDAARES